MCLEGEVTGARGLEGAGGSEGGLEREADWEGTGVGIGRGSLSSGVEVEWLAPEGITELVETVTLGTGS